MKSFLSTMLVFCYIACQFSCTEKEEIASFPPQPGITYATLLVGSGIDSLPLEATAEPWSGFTPGPIAPTWETTWTCVQAPDGAALPIIHRRNALSARATGLALGRYTFEVRFSTKYGTRKNTMSVEVVPDKPAGSQVVINNLEWSLAGNGEYVAFTGLYNRSDLLFFRGNNRFPKVEYQDPRTGQWILSARTNSSPWDAWDLGFYEEGAYFNIVDHNLEITVIAGVTADWLTSRNPKPAVRLTY
jgi:hypothetical protein